jgi:hypothetical protein
MAEVHERYAEREMTTAEFIATAEAVTGEELDAFIRQWLEREGLPELRPSFELRATKKGWVLTVAVKQDDEAYELATHLEVTIDGERRLERLEIDGDTTVELTFDGRPNRVVFNPLDDIPAPRENHYVWRNFIDDFHSTLIVYGTASRIEANHTLARRWQQLVADTYVEILPPLVKDAEIDLETARTHDLMAMGVLDDNYLFHHLSALGIAHGRGWFEFRGRVYSDTDDGIFLVAPNPYNPERVLYLIAANSAKQLYEMTSAYHRGIPSWAVFEGAEIVDQGVFEPEGFVAELD